MNRILLSILTFFVSITLTSYTLASPVFSIGEGGDLTWQQAIDAGNIQPVTGAFSDQADAFYSNSILEAPTANGYQRSEVIELVAIDELDINGEAHDSLVMTWDPPSPATNPDTLGIAAWEYVYDVDPDFTNAAVHFSIGPPVGSPTIWDLSFELVDDQGRVKSWFLSMPLSGWQNHWINAFGGSQGVWGLQGATPGFDITKVVAIQFDSAALNNTAFPPPPPGTTLPAWDWMPFNHLSVTIVPVPAALPLMGSGIALLGWFARRRRVKS